MAQSSFESKPTDQTLQVDEGLLEVFQEEAKELIEGISQSLEEYIKNKNEGLLTDIARDLHTLKGCGQLIAYQGLVELCHGLEELVKSFSKIDPSPNQTQIVEDTLEFFSYSVDQIHTKRAISPPEDILVALNKVEVVDSQGTEPKPTPSNVEVQSVGWEQAYYRISMGDMDAYSRLVNKLIKNFSKESWQVFESTSKINSLIEHLTIIEKNLHELIKLSIPQQSIETKEVYDQISKLKSTLLNLRGLNQQAESFNEKQGNIIKYLEQKIVKTRLDDFRNYIPRLQRTVEQISTKLGKNVELKTPRIEADVDKRLIDKLMPAFEHLIRNALDHGIEFPKERIQTGKPEMGCIEISLWREGHNILFLFKDDGRGIDTSKIEKQALEKGLIKSHEKLTKKIIKNFLLQSGFSTKDTATTVSGRGVGVGAVDHLVRSLGGSMDIAFKSGLYTEFTLSLPIVQSQQTGLLFQHHEYYYYFAMTHLLGIQRIPLKLNRQKPVPEVVYYAGQSFPVLSLCEVLNLSMQLDMSVSFVPVILLSNGRERLGVCVDKIFGTQELITQPAPSMLSLPELIQGVSVLFDQSIAYSIDTSKLINNYGQAGREPTKSLEYSSSRKAISNLKILVVDDSESNLLYLVKLCSQLSIQIYTAHDPLKAFKVLEHIEVDMILTDLEMPNMNGFEFIEALKKETKYKNTPICMMTARRQGNDQIKASSLGVSQFFHKPVQDVELIPYLQEVQSGKH